MKSLGVIGAAAAFLVVLCAGEGAAAPIQRLEVSPVQRVTPSRSDTAIGGVHADARVQLTKAEAMVKQAVTAIKTKDLQLAMEGIRAAKTLVHSAEGSGVVSAELNRALSGAESAINSGDDGAALAQCGVARDQLKEALRRLPGK